MRLLIRCALLIVWLALASSPTTRAQSLWNPYPGNPVLGGNVVDPAVLYDSAGHSYMMWFVRPGGGIWGAVSTNGTTWALEDSIALPAGPSGSYDHMITSVSTVKQGGTYFMYFTASSTGDTVVIGLATSADGRHWQKHPSSPVLRPGPPGSWDCPMVTGAHVAAINGLFRMTYNGYNLVYEDGGLATSVDGIAWTKSPSNPVLPHGSPSSVDARYVSIAGLAFKDSTWYCLYRATNAGGSLTYCAATSADGVLWQKLPRNPVYTPPGNGWDSYQIGGGTLLLVNRQFMFWWSGSNGGPWGIGLGFPRLSGLIDVQPLSLDFGTVRPGNADTLAFLVSDLGSRDTLKVSAVTSTNPRFGSTTVSMSVPPGATGSLRVWYAPSSAGVDTGTISIFSNDPDAPVVRCKVTGRGYVPVLRPVIDTVYVIPRTYYQIRVAWFRSVLDTPGAADQVTQYSLWRMVPGPRNAVAGVRPPADNALSAPGPLWDFIQTIPAAGFNEYSTVIPAFVDYTFPGTWNVFMVGAHTKNLNVYLSDPDSILVDPPPVAGAQETARRASEYSLEQNYPNPFNPSTIIRYSLARSSAVKLAVFNTLGQEVSLLVDAFQDSGPHEVRFDATRLASGIYIYRLSAGEFAQSRKLLLLR